jgi:hypothetical protein
MSSAISGRKYAVLRVITAHESLFRGTGISTRTDAAGDNEIANMWNRREISASSL